MDIKDLNRSQFLLLILLIMMVTSITTATVTVTLMDQSPKAGVVNTINQVIERVIPGATTTVIQVVKEPAVDQGEQIIRAMEAVSPLVARLERQTDAGPERLGASFIVREGWAVTALRNIPAETKAVTLIQNNVAVSAEVSKIDQQNGVAFLKFAPLPGLATTSPAFASLAPKNGQTLIALTLTDNNNVEIVTGLVMGVISASNVIASSSPLSAEVIRTGAVTREALGGPVINLQGEIVGVGIAHGYALAAPALKGLIDRLN